MNRSKEMAIYDRSVVELVAGKFVTTIKPAEVRVLARAEGYAMVRKKGGATFAVREKELRAAGAVTPTPTPSHTVESPKE